MLMHLKNFNNTTNCSKKNVGIEPFALTRVPSQSITQEFSQFP